MPAIDGCQDRDHGADLLERQYGYRLGKELSTTPRNVVYYYVK
jgi:hypothetical protein